MENNWAESLNNKSNNPKQDQPTNRIIGQMGQQKDGRTLLLIAAMYGNETNAYQAIQEVFTSIEKNKIAIKGQLIGLIGNLMAFKEQVAFIDEDLNTLWTKKNRKLFLEQKKPLFQSNEMMEYIQLQRVFENFEQLSPADFLAVNFSESTLAGTCFMAANESIQNQVFTRALKLPFIKNASQWTKANIINHFDECHLAAIELEIPNHANRIRQIKAIIWQLILQLNLINETDYDQFADQFPIPTKASKLYISNTYKLSDAQGEALDKNFMPLKKGDILWSSTHKKILIPEDGILIAQHAKANQYYFLT